jgi:hypothetical protein
MGCFGIGQHMGRWQQNLDTASHEPQISRSQRGLGSRDWKSDLFGLYNLA